MLSSPEVVDLFMQVGKYPQTEDDPVAEYTQEELERKANGVFILAY